MSKLFNFTQVKGKWHKFLSFNLGGAKLYKNFAQKLLEVSLCMAVVLLGTPVTALVLPNKIPTKIIWDPLSFSGTKVTINCSLNPADAGTVDMTVTASNGD